jgi:tripartite-type tricarboxylate transporter receptor subunit TctC
VKSFRIVALLVLACVSTTALAQDKTLRIVIGFPPGAALDTLSRIMAERLRPLLGQAVVVENKPGADGNIGVETVKTAAADGSTVLISPVANMAIFPHSRPADLRYDPVKDFEPVAHLANFQIALAVGAAVPARTVGEYVALVKKDPRLGDHASASQGSLPHFFGVMFARAAGIEMTHIPYKGSGPALQALAGGEIKAGIFTLPDALTIARSGKARVLAVSGGMRSGLAPEVPTFKELGYNIEGYGWYAMFAPARTPKDVVDRYARAVGEVIRAPDMKQRLEQMGLEPTGSGPAELGTLLKADYEKWGPVIRASGFKPTQ